MANCVTLGCCPGTDIIICAVCRNGFHHTCLYNTVKEYPDFPPNWTCENCCKLPFTLSVGQQCPCGYNINDLKKGFEEAIVTTNSEVKSIQNQLLVSDTDAMSNASLVKIRLPAKDRPTAQVHPHKPSDDRKAYEMMRASEQLERLENYLEARRLRP